MVSDASRARDSATRPPAPRRSVGLVDAGDDDRPPAGLVQPLGTATTGTRTWAATPPATVRLTMRARRERWRCSSTTMRAVRPMSVSTCTGVPWHSSWVTGTAPTTSSSAVLTARSRVSCPHRSTSAGETSSPSVTARISGTACTRCRPHPARTASSAAYSRADSTSIGPTPTTTGRPFGSVRFSLLLDHDVLPLWSRTSTVRRSVAAAKGPWTRSCAAKDPARDYVVR